MTILKKIKKMSFIQILLFLFCVILIVLIFRKLYIRKEGWAISTPPPPLTEAQITTIIKHDPTYADDWTSDDLPPKTIFYKDKKIYFNNKTDGEYGSRQIKKFTISIITVDMDTRLPLDIFEKLSFSGDIPGVTITKTKVGVEEFDITGTVSEDSITEKNSTINKNGILVSFNTEELNFDCYIASFEIYIGDGTQIDESFYYYNPVPLQPTEDTYGRLEVDGLGEVLDATLMFTPGLGKYLERFITTFNITDILYIYFTADRDVDLDGWERMYQSNPPYILMLVKGIDNDYKLYCVIDINSNSSKFFSSNLGKFTNDKLAKEEFNTKIYKGAAASEEELLTKMKASDESAFMMTEKNSETDIILYLSLRICKSFEKLDTEVCDYVFGKDENPGLITDEDKKTMYNFCTNWKNLLNNEDADDDEVDDAEDEDGDDDEVDDAEDDEDINDILSEFCPNLNKCINVTDITKQNDKVTCVDVAASHRVQCPDKDKNDYCDCTDGGDCLTDKCSCEAAKALDCCGQWTTTQAPIVTENPKNTTKAPKGAKIDADKARKDAKDYIKTETGGIHVPAGWWSISLTETTTQNAFNNLPLSPPEDCSGSNPDPKCKRSIESWKKDYKKLVEHEYSYYDGDQYYDGDIYTDTKPWIIPTDTTSIYLNNSDLTTIDITNVFNALSNSNPLNIRKLFLSNCNIGKATLNDAETPITCENIKVINDNQIDNNFFKMFENMPHLIMIDLSNNKIGDTIVKQLAEAITYHNFNLNLISLNLSGNLIGDKGAIELSKAFLYARNIEKIDLSDNLICVEGAHYLAESLSKLQNIIYFNINDNYINGYGAMVLAEMIELPRMLFNVTINCNSKPLRTIGRSTLQIAEAISCGQKLRASWWPCTSDDIICLINERSGNWRENISVPSTNPLPLRYSSHDLPKINEKIKERNKLPAKIPKTTLINTTDQLITNKYITLDPTTTTTTTTTTESKSTSTPYVPPSKGEWTDKGIKEYLKITYPLPPVCNCDKEKECQWLDIVRYKMLDPEEPILWPTDMGSKVPDTEVLNDNSIIKKYDSVVIPKDCTSIYIQHRVTNDILNHKIRAPKSIIKSSPAEEDTTASIIKETEDPIYALIHINNFESTKSTEDLPQIKTLKLSTDNDKKIYYYADLTTKAPTKGDKETTLLSKSLRYLLPAEHNSKILIYGEIHVKTDIYYKVKYFRKYNILQKAHTDIDYQTRFGTATSVSHDDKHMNPDMLKALANNIRQSGSKVTTLQIYASNLTGFNAKTLMDAWIKKVSTEETVPVYSELKELHLHNNLLGGHGAQYFSEIIKNQSLLEVLNMSSNQIHGDIRDLAKSLKKTSRLTHLDLSNNENITAQGIIYLSQALYTLPKLEKLNLNNTDISSVYYLSVVLKNMSFIKDLDLGNNNIDTQGAIEIANALKGKKHLERLDLSKNNISDGSVDALTQLLHPVSSRALTKLNLSGNKFTRVGVAKLVTVLKKRPELEIYVVCDVEPSTSTSTPSTSEDKVLYSYNKYIKIKKLSTIGIDLTKALCCPNCEPTAAPLNTQKCYTPHTANSVVCTKPNNRLFADIPLTKNMDTLLGDDYCEKECNNMKFKFGKDQHKSGTIGTSVGGKNITGHCEYYKYDKPTEKKKGNCKLISNCINIGGIGAVDDEGKHIEPDFTMNLKDYVEYMGLKECRGDKAAAKPAVTPAATPAPTPAAPTGAPTNGILTTSKPLDNNIDKDTSVKKYDWAGPTTAEKGGYGTCPEFQSPKFLSNNMTFDFGGACPCNYSEIYPYAYTCNTNSFGN
jgi:Ran GTPase-activating protein (RanGAP) involved in mRNA processing and transport